MMSHASPSSAANSSGPNHESTNTSSVVTEKYPVASTDEGYPEVAASMTQPPLQPYQQPNYGYPQQQPHHLYAPVEEQPLPASRKANPWGLSPLAFGLLVAAITAVVVGGAVGGGVGGAMSGSDSKSSRYNPAPERTKERLTGFKCTCVDGHSHIQRTNIYLRASPTILLAKLCRS